MAKSKNSSTSEYMKIRRYVINRIAAANGQSIQLPTLLELSKKFKVSNTTVCKALKTLTEDGYLIGKRGIGLFTAPRSQHFTPIAKKRPNIGILIGDGMSVHYSNYTAALLAELLKALTSQPSFVQILQLSSKNPENIYEELKNEHLDALVWYNSENFLKDDLIFQKWREDHFPVVTCNFSMESYPSVRMNGKETARECGKILLANHCKNIIFFPETEPWLPEAEGLRQAYREAGIELNPRFFLKDISNVHLKLREIIEYGVRIDAIFGHLVYPFELLEYLNGFAPEVSENCIFVDFNIVHSADDSRSRIKVPAPLKEFAETAADLLFRQLNGENVENKPVEIKMNVIQTGNIKK